MYPSTSSWANRCLMVLLCLACCTSALAQSTGGRILGRVADPTGAVLAGVNIALVNEATGVSRTTQTNSSGDYTFLEVQPGFYALSFEQKGFKTKLPSGRLAQYEYVRYFFSNLSEDIKDIFCRHADQLGIRWSRANPRYVSIHDRKSVAILDSFVGPKR